MKYQQTHNGTFPLVTISLNQGEEVKVERGSMVFHNGKVAIEGKMNSNGEGGLGGLLKSVARSVVSGESFFITTAKGTAPGGQIAIAPASIGGIREIQAGEKQWCINDGSFLACDNTLTYNIERQSIGKAILGGTGGLFIMKTSGSGTMLVNSFGDLLEIEIDGSSPFVIDNQHVIAWESNLRYELRIASGTFGFTTGEGIVNEFNGQGKILVQTRNAASLARILIPFLPKSQ